MTISLQVPPEATSATFSRAMAALSAHPNQRVQDRNYRYLPPFRKLVLARDPAERAEISAARPVGWQFFIWDSLGKAVLDVSDKIPDTFSSVRRGAFAERYEEVLESVDADCGMSDNDYRAEVLEVPQLGTCALVVRDGAGAWFYPVLLNGKTTYTRSLSEEEFFATVPRLPQGPRHDDGDEPGSPTI